MVSAVLSVASDVVKHPLRQLAGFFLCLSAVYLAVSLITYHSADPSFNRATMEAAMNAGGYLGALMSDLALQVLGLACLTLIFVPLTWGIKMVLDHRISYLWLRTTLLLVVTVLLASFLSMIDSPVNWPISSGLGGSLGALLHDKFAFLFGNIFFALCLAATIGFMLALAFGMSFDEWKWIYGQVRAAAALVWAVLSSPFRAPTEDEEELFDEEGDALPWYKRVGPRLSSSVRNWRNSDDEDEEYDEDEESDEDDEDGDEEEEESDEEEEEVSPRSRRKKTAVKKPKGTARKAQGALDLPQGDFMFPPIGLLGAAPRSRKSDTNEAALLQNAKLLEQVLQEFGVSGQIIEVRPGPVVTLYELEPAAGTKSARVIGLADDIARSMSAVSARIAVIPGRNVIGVELPNHHRETVYFRDMLESEDFQGSEAKLPLALGKDIGGQPIIADLAKMPHLLVAGTTGSGKSVAINTMILSLLYRLSPDEVKFIMIDPKMLELSAYDNIPHLLSPVVTEPGKAVVALKWTVKEMENRYRLMSAAGVRNIDGYNKAIRDARAKGKQLTRPVQTGFDVDTGQPIIENVPLEMTDLPFIVVVVDEMADLMLVAGKDIESSIQRLAQMARAAGIHIIMATQRPSVDVITGVIKANFPTRISFQVTSRIDSRTILGEQGAEQLLGHGDMLYMAGGGRITRVHGPFVADKEVEHVVAHLRTQGEPTYLEDVTKDDEEEGEEGGDESGDPLYDQAVSIVLRDRKASTSYIQRCLKVGYNKAATLIEKMEREGVVSPPNHSGKREVLG
jgi:DNA segregation ATPase FtsK/SpoIIIE, S-DNA-T family